MTSSRKHKSTRKNGGRRRDDAPSAGGRRASAPLAALAVILLLTIIAYIPAMRAEMVWDDDTYITNNLALRSADGLRQIWFEPLRTPAYYPVLFSMLWIEYQTWGTEPGGYHVVNIILHCLNVVLVFVLLRRLEVRGALLATGLFALHPVHVESVAWIAERKDVLSGTFLLLAIISWLEFLRNGARSRYVATLVMHTLAMLSKSVASAFPLVAILLAVWKRPADWRRMMLLTLPMFAVSVVFGLITKWRESIDADVAQGFTLIESVLLAGRNVAFYLSKFALPVDLMAVYPKWQISAADPLLWAGLLVLSAALVLLFVLRRRIGTAPLVAIVFFILCHAPTLGLVEFNFMNYSYVADRYQYLAILGPCALVAAVLAWATRGRLPQAGRRGAALALLLVMAAMSWSHARTYHDVLTMARHNLSKNPDSWAAHASIGVALARSGDLAGATTHLQSAVDLHPTYATGRYDLAVVYFMQEELDDAHREFSELVRVDPDYPDAQYSLGVVKDRLGLHDEAVPALRLALEHSDARTRERRLPPSAKVRLELANALYMTGDFAEAARYYGEVLASQAPAQIDLDYVHLSRYVATARSAGDAAARAVLDQATGKGPLPAIRSGWLRRVADFHRGEVSAGALLAEAAATPASERAGRLCEARYHLGMRALLDGDTVTARRELEACVATGATTYVEYRRAGRELERLGS